MLRDDAIYSSLFRFQDINLNNVNDINFAINIAVIATTLFETFVIIIFILELVIVIVFDVDIVVVIAIVSPFEGPVFKFIAFGFDIKDCLAMSASFDKF